MSQFTFQTRAQYMEWERRIASMKNRYGYSLEMFFLNRDGTLNYRGMLDTVDRLIRDGVMNPIGALDPHNHLARDIARNPEQYGPATLVWESLHAIKQALLTISNLPDDGILEMSADEFAFDDE